MVDGNQRSVTHPDKPKTSTTEQAKEQMLPRQRSFSCHRSPVITQIIWHLYKKKQISVFNYSPFGGKSLHVFAAPLVVPTGQMESSSVVAPTGNELLQSGEGSLQATYDTDGKIVFVSSKADRMEDERKKKMWKNDKPEDAVDKYEDEEPVSRPNGTERAEVEKIMVKKPQRGEAVRNVSFNKCGDKLVSAGYDCCLKLLDTETDDVVSRFMGLNLTRRICIVQEYGRRPGAVNKTTFVGENRSIVTTSDDKGLHVWEWDISVDIKYIADPTMLTIPTGSIRRTQILEFLLQLAEAGHFHSYLTLDVVYKIELEVHKKPIASSVFRSTWLRGLRELRYRFWVSVDSV
ncbi:pre-mRNA splicing factor prp17 [Culex quinquefasciatus]|uniref:Pre-mRNA splicing factor prp17 n=1 Tax=Culex quinquefasciatus TaxID=7176 RepID=B0X305_CULQU|nr:pre-mRNA splicing factor prp17 [Culex quinquefasciatus]|eukprot:XP_001864027.1 pre-mRNA splicing factor prp17 [Culex quinquefasciatus]